jgi:tyrosine-protein phosphatase SIW14
MNLRSLVLCLTLSSAIFSFTASADPATDILQFKEITPNIYRGARPETIGMEDLKKFGIKTDLDIENHKEPIAQEKIDAENLGMNFISLPMSGVWKPKDAEVAEILAILNDPSNFPIFLHCHHGEDRTGLIAGLYRVFTQNWTPEQAHEEMIADGFHTNLYFLNRYFNKQTGYED